MLTLLPPLQGPVYTERALYLKVDSKGEVEVVNTLGLKLKDIDELQVRLYTQGSLVLLRIP